MEWDEEYMVPVRIEIWKMDIVLANKFPELKNEQIWALDHELPATFSMDDLSPSSFKKFSQMLFKDQKMLDLYQDHRMGGGDGIKNSVGQTHKVGDRYFACLVENEHYARWKCIFGEGWDLYYMIKTQMRGQFDGMSYLLIAHFFNPILEALQG